MKLGILGDVHGNYRALNAVLLKAQLLNVKVLLVTGDLVGYYNGPKAVMEMLSSWDCYIVRGNHEDMLKRARYDDNFLTQIDVKYGIGLRVAIEQLGETWLDYLCNLPHPLEVTIDRCKILLCHGSPWDNNHYIYPDFPLDDFEKSLKQPYDLVVLGHTHYPMRYDLGATILLNPGSVGQPRNRQPGAQWVVYDTESRSVDFFNEDYDRSELVEECRINNPDLPYLSEILNRT